SGSAPAGAVSPSEPEQCSAEWSGQLRVDSAAQRDDLLPAGNQTGGRAADSPAAQAWRLPVHRSLREPAWYRERAAAGAAVDLPEAGMIKSLSGGLDVF